MENILISVIAKIAEYTVEPIGRKLGYLCFIHDNIQKLEIEITKLRETRELCVQRKVAIAERNAEDIKPVVERWLSRVDDIVAESNVILRPNEGGHVSLCSMNLVQRYNLSKRARNLANEALTENHKGENFETVSDRPILSLSALPKVHGFLNFESRNSTMEKILDALSNDNIHRIGVHGMGGIGKTQLVKEILRRIKENNLFDEGVLSIVSQTPDYKHIQGELGDQLDLRFEQETMLGRSLKLRKRLKKKSILIVLDDVWGPIDLEKIGIPSVDEHGGCKILFTTRERDWLSSEMCVDVVFEIKMLEKDESWNLFKAMAGEIVETSDVKPIAIQIVRECGSLPLAITTVAKALKVKNLSSIWNDALDQLKRDDVDVNVTGMTKTVYSSLKLSYDFLDGEEVKLLFLLCSMYPEDFDIDVKELSEYAMTMGFLRGVDTVAQGRRRIMKLVDDLKSSSLLEQSELGNNYVKMHDMVRDVSISIASKNDRICLLSYVKKPDDEWKEEKLSGNYIVVSIRGFHDTIPKLMLPKVQLIKLDGTKSLYDYYYNRYFISMTETFFEEMKELKVLELHRMEISLLPASLNAFANIRLLRLSGCRFGSMDMIGELKKVEILDFSSSNITQLPTTISQLTQLKVLNLTWCYELKVIPPNILSKLTKLEELSLGTFDRWEREELFEGRKNASLSELRYLPHLRVLKLSIQDEEIMPKQLFSRELTFEEFDIRIGPESQSILADHFEIGDCNILRQIYLNMESESCLNEWIKTLLKRSDKLILEGSIGSKALHLEPLDDANDLLLVKLLCLCENIELRHFIDEKYKSLRKCLSKLEHLHIEYWENLESIINGYDRESPNFNKLKRVSVDCCSKLETLFLNCTFDDVLNLEQIASYCCEKLEVVIIVMENEEATNHMEFTHLKTLSRWFTTTSKILFQNKYNWK